MKIASVRIQNFRSFVDETIPLNDYSCLVGPNGAGKSTVLTALNLFFRESENIPTDLSQLDVEDFHRKKTSSPIQITVTFTCLGEDAQEDFANYYRQGKLIVSAVATFDENTGKAQVKQFGQRLGMEDFAPFFEALNNNERATELKKIYGNLRDTFVDLPSASTKDAMKKALHAYEADHPDQCILIPSEDEFYGFSRGSNRLAKHIQWVYVPAVKDPTSEQVETRNSALGQLLARTVRPKTNFSQTLKALQDETQSKYQALLDDSQPMLSEISTVLESGLSEWAHPDVQLSLQWKQDDKSVRVEEPFAHIIAGESGFEGELARFGHGFQRSYLLALLQQLATTDAADAPTLILACEEPELYQHPPQARHLAGVFQDLTRTNSQVIVSTHSPLFVSGEGFENVRMVRKGPINHGTFVSHMNFADIAQAVGAATGSEPSEPEGALAKVHQALQSGLNEMFFARRLILVEGLEDWAYLLTCLHLLGQYDEYRRKGCHVVPTNGKSELIRPLVIAKHMGIPTYVVFDADADKPDRSGSWQKHESDNKALLSLLGVPAQNPMPNCTIWGKGFTMWRSDIGSVVEADIGKEDWEKFQNEADRRYGHAGGLKKYTLHIGASLAFAWDQGKRPVNLERLCWAILDADNQVPLSNGLVSSPG